MVVFDMLRVEYSVVTLAAAAILACAAPAMALPVSSCVSGVGGMNIDADHFTCNFFTSDVMGNLATDTGLITDPAGANPVGPGYLVFLMNGTVDNTANEMNTSDWEEVLLLVANGMGVANTFELFTGASMPTYNTVTNYNGGGDYAFLVQNANGIYDYQAYQHEYFVYSTAATTSFTPEPSTVGLILLGSLGLLMLRRKSATVGSGVN